MEKKIYTKEEIENLLNTSNLAVEKGLISIFNHQTYDEQSTEDTRYLNKVGFSGAHCHRGSYLAKWIKSGKHLDGKFIKMGRRLVFHYAGQLTKIANGEIPSKV